MSNVFLPKTMMGTLRYKRVYEFFEEPRFFSAENEVNSLFVVYWIGEDEDADSWYVIPVSPSRLELIERKRIDLRTILVEQEQSFFYEVRAPYDRDIAPEWNVKDVNAIYDYALPVHGLFISSVVPVLENGRIGEAIKYSTHEIHLEKSSKKSAGNLVLSHVSNVCDSFSALYDSLLEYSGLKDKLRPVDARPGSFILSFQAEKLNTYEEILRDLSALIERRADIVEFIQNNGIDVQAFCDLLQSIVSTGTNLELKSNQTGGVIFLLTKAGAEFYLREISRMSSLAVSGHQIPQADILEKVFKVVEVKWSGEPCSFENTGLQERHVYYYLHAARVLGLLNANSHVTATGQKLVQSEQDNQYKIAARCFEVSHIGWAWINWSGVDNLSQIDPDTAEAFLLEQCRSLSRDTIVRRARTLRHWGKELKEKYTPL
ncbi:hypothetical protein MUY32_16135 [Enterobacter roggenkampii]|uniref:DUF6575 domain-containing protein n=1 Tax=Enterobacter roggenkampii TaxID=1812935 RepID=UPI00165DAA4B|nr:DUF6575 domain-containing protein [Enterobacter roggenkampii]QNR12241.1 hypothetical protein G3T53_16045 [Enterobacter roggenkampii]UQQ40532.1 hypothetical protein MUY32_16135 [Enterobacter roggenkampii]